MDRRAFLGAGVTGAALSVAASMSSGADAAPGAATAPAADGAKTSRPNIIWVFGDQHRAQAMSCAGDANLSTPNMDALAAEGRHFTAALSGMPICCPFRGSMLTGRYPHVCVPGHEYRLPPDMPTVVGPLKAAGYHTGYFGKWHLDGFHESTGRAAMHIIPPERRGGFDEWIGYENNNAQYDCWVHGGQGPAAFHYKLATYETDALTDLFIKFLKERAKESAGPGARPFFGVLSVQPPHDPYIAPPEYMAKHKAKDIALRPNVPNVKRVLDRARPDLAGAYAQIENLDFNLGRIRKALAEAGLDSSTYVIFFSDHGDMHGSQGQFRKTTPYEELLRIPLIIGGGAKAGPVARGKDAALFGAVDFAPTTLGLAGLSVPEGMQGTDYSPRVLQGRAAKDDPDSAFLQSVIATGHHDSVDRPWRGVATADGWKYICFDGVPWLMFNLAEDPYEQVNLAHNTAFAAQRKKLQDRLAAWIKKTGDTLALPKM